MWKEEEKGKSATAIIDQHDNHIVNYQKKKR